MNKLEQARQSINAIDKQMADLFVQRMQAVRMVSEYKIEHGLPVLDAAREEQVIARNSALVEDETMRSYYVNFLRNNMGLSRQYQQLLQQGLKVAYCGVEGAFAYIAARKIFDRAEKCAYTGFADAYNAVVKGDCDCAVLPIENSYAGEVSQVVDLLFSGPLHVNGIYELEITHNLLGLPDATREDITTVISHPQALAQCAAYIEHNGFEARSASNTAVAAKKLVETGDKTVAAIASRDTAELYGLKVLESHINASNTNTTRFAVFSRVEENSAGARDDQFILVFTVRHEAGALAKAIQIIGDCGFNMRTLRSRPMKELLWQYYFYVEADGNSKSPEGVRMMQELSQVCDKLRIVGRFSHQTKL